MMQCIMQTEACQLQLKWLLNPVRYTKHEFLKKELERFAHVHSLFCHGVGLQRFGNP